MYPHVQSRRFLREATSWLRSLPDLHTEVREDDELDPGGSGRARLDAYLLRPSAVNGWGYAGAWALFAGAVLSMFGMPAFGQGINRVLNEVGYVVFALGVAAVIEFWIESRLKRSPLQVELRSAAAPLTEASLRQLRDDAQGGVVWVISEEAPSAEVLELATSLGMQWITLHSGPRFVPARAA